MRTHRPIGTVPLVLGISGQFFTCNGPHRPIGTVPLVLGISGQFFTCNGQPWTAIESSDFSLYKRHLDGEDIRPVLQERASIGFNLLRVWLLNTSVIPGGILPSQYQGFYASLAPFAALCASFGLCVEFTAFTQTQTLMPRAEDQRTHWLMVCDALRGVGNALCELVNEADQHDNRTDASLLSMRPKGILCSSGSNGADSPCPVPVWDYGLYHSNGLNEWQRKAGHNPMADIANVYSVPAGSNENTRFPDQDSSEAHAEDAAAGVTLLCALGCFHSEGGKQSRLFDPTESRCATAWVRGAKSVPLRFQHGQYFRRDDMLKPGLIRVYEKRLPTESWFVEIRA